MYVWRGDGASSHEKRVITTELVAVSLCTCTTYMALNHHACIQTQCQTIAEKASYFISLKRGFFADTTREKSYFRFLEVFSIGEHTFMTLSRDMPCRPDRQTERQTDRPGELAFFPLPCPLLFSFLPPPKGIIWSSLALCYIELLHIFETRSFYDSFSGRSKIYVLYVPYYRPFDSIYISERKNRFTRIWK